MMRYVCGFAFTTPDDSVVLSRTKRGMWQGLLNGPGGKQLHRVESHRTAMRREFLEETGIDVDVNRWFLFHEERFRNGNEVYYHFCRLFEDEIPAVETEETTNHVIFNWRSGLHGLRVAPGLGYLIPMAFDLLNRPVWDRPL